MTITSLFSRLVLALTLATGASAAMATQASYHVTLDTTSFAGDGYLDLGFGGLEDAAAATAVVSNVTGAITNVTSVIGTVNGDLTGTATFIAADSGDLAQLVHLGGVFGFDVLFDFADTGTGVSFALSLFDTDFFNLLDTDYAAQIFLTAGAGSSFATYTRLADVTELTAAVPEPGQWLLMVTGLLILGAAVRRRSV